MAKTQNPVLLLTDAERSALRRAKITVRDLGNLKPEDVVKATAGVMTIEHARENCALAAHYTVDGIGMSLASDFWEARRRSRPCARCARARGSSTRR